MSASFHFATFIVAITTERKQLMKDLDWAAVVLIAAADGVHACLASHDNFT